MDLYSVPSCGLQHLTLRISRKPSLRTLERVATTDAARCLTAVNLLSALSCGLQRHICTRCLERARITMCTLTLSSVKDAPVVQCLIPTISTLGREVAPYIGAKQLYETLAGSHFVSYRKESVLSIVFYYFCCPLPSPSLRTLVRVATVNGGRCYLAPSAFTPHFCAGCNRKDFFSTMPDCSFTPHSRAGCNEGGNHHTKHTILHSALSCGLQPILEWKAAQEQENLHSALSCGLQRQICTRCLERARI